MIVCHIDVWCEGGLVPLPRVVDAVGGGRVVLLLLQPDLTLHAEQTLALGISFRYFV